MSSHQADGSRRRKITVSLLIPVAAVSCLVATDTAPAQAASPSCVIVNYYGQGASGTGNYGTADSIRTWSSWNVPNESSGGFSDESVWSIDYNNIGNSLEVGFFVGYGNGNLHGGSSYTNGQIPYYTLSNGEEEADYWGTSFPGTPRSVCTRRRSATPRFSQASAVKEIDVNTGYVVDQPRWNFAQGETSEPSATMGGGSGGDDSTMYWLNSACNFEPWAYINTCADSPYWANSDNGTDDFENGGPG